MEHLFSLVARLYVFKRSTRLPIRPHCFTLELNRCNSHLIRTFSLAVHACRTSLKSFVLLPTTIVKILNATSVTIFVYRKRVLLLSISLLLLSKFFSFYFPLRAVLHPCGIKTLLGVKWLKMLNHHYFTKENGLFKLAILNSKIEKNYILIIFFIFVVVITFQHDMVNTHWKKKLRNQLYYFEKNDEICHK